MTTNKENTFEEFLVKEKLVTEDELKVLENEISLKGIHLFKALLNHNVDSMEKMDCILYKTSVWLGCEYFSNSDELQPALEIPGGIERNIFIHTKVCPVRIEVSNDGTDTITNLATINPFDIQLHDIMTLRFPGKKLKWHIAHPLALERAIQYMRTAVLSGGKEVSEVIDFSREMEEIYSLQLDNVSVPVMINWFIYKASKSRASDIHLEPGEKATLVRFRIDGLLIEEASLANELELHPEIVSRIKILSDMDVAEKRLPQDGKFKVKIASNDIDLRVSSLPTFYGEKIVLRLLERSALQPSLEEIGFQKEDLKYFHRSLNNPYGMIIISGPTGSGKTTTLYSAINTLDISKKNVVTVEDPIEYRLAGVHQLQIKEKIGLTFASSLRNILRQDPDVILIGEIRDTDTAEIAVRAALTGHIVLSTLHTNNAIGVVTRLLDTGIEPFLLSSALSLAMAQRLVRKVCDKCRESITGKEVLDRLFDLGITKNRLEGLKIVVNPEYNSYAWGRKCSECRGTGYYGRRAVIELFEVDDAIRKVIATHPLDELKLYDLARKQGMKTLMEHGKSLVDEGVTTVEELVRVLGVN